MAHPTHDQRGDARIMLLCPSTSHGVKEFLRAADAMNLDVMVGVSRACALERLSNGRIVSLDFDAPEDSARWIARAARRCPLRAVLGIDDKTTVIAGAASRMLGLANNTAASLGAARDKYTFRTVLARAGLPTPRFRLVSLREDLERVAASNFYPCVLKPRCLSGSRGVIRADGPKQFVRAARRTAVILRDLVSGEHAESLLVEAFVPGWEVALEGLLANGRLQVLALFDKPEPLDGPFFEETVYVTPSRLPGRQQRAIAATVTAAANALGLQSGPIHAELRVNADGIWPIELAARAIGGRCARSLSFGNGVQLEELILRQALGLPTSHLDRERRASGVMMMPIPGAGRLQRIEGVESARAVRGIEGVAIDVHIGEHLVPLPEGDRYLGFLFAKGDNSRRVHAALRKAFHELRFQIAD